MKKGKLIGVLALVMCIMTGCVDHMPEMTQEQSDLIAEYAADLLLKYSPNYEYRLADESLFVEVPTEVVSEEATEITTKVEEERTVVTETQQAEKESIHVETNIEGTQEAEETKTQVGPASITEVDLAELFALEGLKLSYDSYEVCSSYPNKPESSGFTVSAAEDSALLIVHFTVENVSKEKVQCDLFEAGVDISANVNKSGEQSVMNTLLTNDITTFIETMDASDKQEIVAVFEIGAEEEIESLTMKISKGRVTEKVRIE